MYYGIKKWWLRCRIAVWKYFLLSAQTRKDSLSKKLEQEKKHEEEHVENMLRQMRTELEKTEAFRLQVQKEYWLWKSQVLKDLKASLGSCEKCQRSRLEDLTIDHIIPQEMLRLIGMPPDLERDKRNLRLLCKICNSQKANRLDFTDHRTKPLLIEYVRRVEGPEEYVQLTQQARKKPTRTSRFLASLGRLESGAITTAPKTEADLDHAGLSPSKQ